MIGGMFFLGRAACTKVRDEGPLLLSIGRSGAESRHWVRAAKSAVVMFRCPYPCVYLYLQAH